MWRDGIARGNEPWLAESGGEVVGLSLAVDPDAPGQERLDSHLADDQPPGLELAMLYLLESHHGSGLGQRLLDVAVGDGPAYLWVAEDNPRAVRLLLPQRLPLGRRATHRAELRGHGRRAARPSLTPPPAGTECAHRLAPRRRSSTGSVAGQRLSVVAPSLGVWRRRRWARGRGTRSWPRWRSSTGRRRRPGRPRPGRCRTVELGQALIVALTPIGARGSRRSRGAAAARVGLPGDPGRPRGAGCADGEPAQGPVPGLAEAGAADVENAKLTCPDTGTLRELGAALAEGAVSREHVDVARCDAEAAAGAGWCGSGGTRSTTC